jgi:hypothetical protein
MKINLIPTSIQEDFLYNALFWVFAKSRFRGIVRTVVGCLSLLDLQQVYYQFSAFPNAYENTRLKYFRPSSLKCNSGNVQIHGAAQILCSSKPHLPDENGDEHPVGPIILLCRLVRPLPIVKIGRGRSPHQN